MNNELLKAVQQYTTNGIFSDISELGHIQLLKWYDGNTYNQTFLRIKQAFEILSLFHIAGGSDIDFENISNKYELDIKKVIQLYSTHKELLLTDRFQKTRIIAFEGIDGSGKTVQINKLKETIETLGYSVIIKSFPVYESFFGREVGNLLSGTKQVSAETLDPKSMCLWYALDRWKEFKDFEYKQYDFVLLNRFSLSSATYQSIRTIPEERNALISWVFELEHVHLELPSPDIYFLFDSSPEISTKNIMNKGYRDYVGNKPDVYEASSELMSNVREQYLSIAKNLKNSVVVNCVKDNGLMKDVNDIFYEVKRSLETWDFLSITQ